MLNSPYTKLKSIEMLAEAEQYNYLYSVNQEDLQIWVI